MGNALYKRCDDQENLTLIYSVVTSFFIIYLEKYRGIVATAPVRYYITVSRAFGVSEITGE